MLQLIYFLQNMSNCINLPRNIDHWIPQASLVSYSSSNIESFAQTGWTKGISISLFKWKLKTEHRKLRSASVKMDTNGIQIHVRTNQRLAGAKDFV